MKVEVEEFLCCIYGICSKLIPFASHLVLLHVISNGGLTANDFDGGGAGKDVYPLS